MIDCCLQEKSHKNYFCNKLNCMKFSNDILLKFNIKLKDINF